MNKSKMVKNAQSLRFIIQKDQQLRLELLAAISRLLRDYELRIDDELLASLILAVPSELVGQGYPGSERAIESLMEGTPPSGELTPPSGGLTQRGRGLTPPSGRLTPPSGGLTPPSGGVTPPSSKSKSIKTQKGKRSKK